MGKMKFVLSSVIAVSGFYLAMFLATPVVFAGAGSVNHVAIFLGETDSDSTKTTDFTAGIEYERRLPFLNSMFGVGLTFERIFYNKKDIDIYLLNFIAHPWKGLKFNVSPGKERKLKKGKVKTFDLFRYGVAYDFHVGQYSVTPMLNIDTVKGKTATVYGIAFGMGF